MMKKYNKVLTLLALSLMFAAIFSRGSEKEVTKVLGSTNEGWTEVESITNGHHYLITISEGGNDYLLKAGEYTTLPTSVNLVFDENLTLADAWTFIGDNTNGYIITASNGARLYHRGLSDKLFSVKNIHELYVNNKQWRYVDGKLINNGHYLAKALNATAHDWRVPDQIIPGSHVGDITLYEYSATVSEDLTRFKTIKDMWLGRKANGQCHEFVPPLLTYYDGLSNEAKIELHENSAYAIDAEEILYYSAWYLNLPQPSNDVSRLNELNNNNLILLFILTSVSVLTYFVIISYKKVRL